MTRLLRNLYRFANDPIEKVDDVNINRNETPVAGEDGYGEHNKTALK